MIIQCAICGSDLEIDDNTADGQHFLCPYCGEKFEYRRQSGGGQSAAKPKLSIRRSNPQQDGSTKGRRPNSLVQQVDARARAAARKARHARLKALFHNLIALIILGGLGWGGYEGWRIWKDGKSVDLPPVVGELVEKVLPSESEPEEDSLSPEELAEQEADRQRKAEEERRREMERQREQEEAKLRETENAHAEEYLAVREAFIGAKLAYWNELPKSRRPGSVDGLFGLAVPRGRGRCEYFRVMSRTDGVTVQRVSEKIPPQDVSQEEYKKLMLDYGGFFLVDGTAYFVTASDAAKTWTPPTDRYETFSPAKAFFADAYPVIDERKLATTGRGFEVFFSLDDKSKPIRIGEVPFDGEVRYAAFAEAAKGILKGMRKKGGPPRVKKQQVKQTVVFYDGCKIAKDIRGVTKIPRTWAMFERGYPRKAYRNSFYGYSVGDSWEDYERIRDRYRELREEALRQDQEVEEAEEEYRRTMSEWKEKRDAPPTESEIQSVLYAGIVTIKRK